jgi:uncharacterized protein YkwD
MHKLLVVAALTALLVGGATLPASADATDEAELFGLLNATREEQGLPPLLVDVSLIVSARSHTEALAAQGELFHSTWSELARSASHWELLGENVGRGPSVEAVHEAFMASESHRANMLGEFDRAGVGAVRSADGTLFATVVFMKRSEDAPADQGISSTMLLVSALPEFAVSRLLDAVAVFERTERDLCSPVGSAGTVCID